MEAGDSSLGWRGVSVADLSVRGSVAPALLFAGRASRAGCATPAQGTRQKGVECDCSCPSSSSAVKPAEPSAHSIWPRQAGRCHRREVQALGPWPVQRGSSCSCPALAACAWKSPLHCPLSLGFFFNVVSALQPPPFPEPQHCHPGLSPRRASLHLQGAQGAHRDEKNALGSPDTCTFLPNLMADLGSHVSPWP